MQTSFIPGIIFLFQYTDNFVEDIKLTQKIRDH